MFCPDCGLKASDTDRFCGGCGAPLAFVAARQSDVPPPAPQNPREALLAAIEQALAAYPQLTVTRGPKSDLEIKSTLADARWGTGKKKVDYSGALLAREAERKVVYWEMTKEVGAGMSVPFGFKVETYRTDGRSASGRVREAGWGPGGKAIDYDWDYARTRRIIEEVVRAHGWRFSTALLRRNAER